MTDPRATSANSISGIATNPMIVIHGLAELGVSVQPNGRGEVMGTVANAREVLEKHPRFKRRFWLDTFHQEIFTTWDGSEPRRWADVDRIAIADVLQGEMGLFRFTPELVEQAVMVIAMKNQRDELRDWLKSLRWDGISRLDAWLTNAAGVPKDEYHTAIARNFIISMVARGLAPGCKVDTMPVFEGSQGKGKSTLLSVLGGKFYAELTDPLDSKDFFVSIQGKWLVEIAELDAFRKTEVTRIKQALSAQVDRFRPPYGKHSIDAPRRTVFAGTTNESDYLRDATGARRFWPALVGDMNLDWLRQNREQIFAEAVEQYQGRATWWEIPERAHREHTDARREDDAWEAPVADYCLGRTEVSSPDVLRIAVGVDLAKQGKAELMRAARILKALGYDRVTVKRAGKAVKRWIKGEPEPDAAF